MPEEAYKKFEKNELIVRDLLALDRTVLANERTLLAYFRTALALILSGATGIHLFSDTTMRLSGWALITLGIVILLFGLNRFRRVQKHLRNYSGI